MQKFHDTQCMGGKAGLPAVAAYTPFRGTEWYKRHEGSECPQFTIKAMRGQPGKMVGIHSGFPCDKIGFAGSWPWQGAQWRVGRAELHALQVFNDGNLSG